MSKHSSDSNSRDRNRSYNRRYTHRHRSSSSSSTESSRHSKKNYSSTSRSRYYKKSKYRHRSSSLSDYSSRHKYSSRTRETSHSKRSHRQRNTSSSNESTSNSYSNASSKLNQSKSSKTINGSENTQKNSSIHSQADLSKMASKDKIDLFQQNVDDTLKMEKSIEEINQEGFVFKVFKSSTDQKDDDSNDFSNLTSSKLNEDIINSLPVEKSTFVISNQNRLLCARYTLLTKQERCLQWAKLLFASYEESEKDD